MALRSAPHFPHTCADTGPLPMHRPSVTHWASKQPGRVGATLTLSLAAQNVGRTPDLRVTMSGPPPDGGDPSAPSGVTDRPPCCERGRPCDPPDAALVRQQGEGGGGGQGGAGWLLAAVVRSAAATPTPNPSPSAPAAGCSSGTQLLQRREPGWRCRRRGCEGPRHATHPRRCSPVHQPAGRCSLVRRCFVRGLQRLWGCGRASGGSSSRGGRCWIG